MWMKKKGRQKNGGKKMKCPWDSNEYEEVPLVDFPFNKANKGGSHQLQNVEMSFM